MQSVYLLVLLGASAFVKCQICNVQEAENPVAGINLNETEAYPESNIKEALAADNRTAELIAAAAKETEIQTKFELSSQVSIASSLCRSTFYQHFPRKWTYVDATGMKCWILQNWWISPLSYVYCPRQYCMNLPCGSRSHYCVPTNYKVYIAWFWCNRGGFQFRKFKLPQCCECQQFCFNNVIVG